MSDGDVDVITPSELLDETNGENALFPVSPTHPGEWDGCTDLLTIQDSAELNVWSFGITRSPEHQIEHWHRQTGDAPAAFRIISPSTADHTEAHELAEAYGFDPLPEFETIDHIGNLPRIGLSLQDALRTWRDTDRQTVVCFHSICAILQYASVEEVYQFLNTMTQDVRQENALAHYHLDPNALDSATLAKFRGLFDTVINQPSIDD